MKIQFVKTHESARLPEKNYKDPLTGDAGLDLFCTEDVIIPAGGSIVAPVGLKVAYITPGYWFRIEGRSGLGFVRGVQPHFGVIDNSYRGDLGVKLYNLTDKSVLVEAGKGVAQIIAYEMIETDVSFVDEVKEGSRGEQGFGSSDK